MGTSPALLIESGGSRGKEVGRRLPPCALLYLAVRHPAAIALSGTPPPAIA